MFKGYDEIEEKRQQGTLEVPEEPYPQEKEDTRSVPSTVRLETGGQGRPICKGLDLFPWEQPETCLGWADRTRGVTNKQKYVSVSRKKIHLAHNIV